MRQCSWLVAVSAAGAVLFGTGLPAAALDPVTRGQALAEQWCSTCHAVQAGAGGSDQVPSFERIVQDRERNEEWPTTWLSVPHQSMPSFSLSRQEISDLVAYMKSLKAAE